MGPSVFDDVLIGGDVPDAFGREAIFAETNRIMDFMANDLVSNEMAAAQISYWTACPTQFWKAFSAFRGILHPGPRHVALLRDAADDLLSQPFVVAADYRAAYALRLWADRIEAEAQTVTEAA